MCNTCFCFRDVRRATLATGMFTLVCSSIQILVTIAVFTGINEIYPVTFSPPSADVTTAELYIALACADFLLVIFSILFLFGNERSNEMVRKCYMYPWLILVPIYFVYESAINIYYFYNQFQFTYSSPLIGGSAKGFVIVPLVYWIVKEIILIVGYLFLIMHMQTYTPPPQHRPAPYHADMMSGHYNPEVYMRPTPMALPPAPAPAHHACTACQGGFEQARCPHCSVPKPLYGYAGMSTGAQTDNNIVKSGWVTSVYNNGR